MGKIEKAQAQLIAQLRNENKKKPVKGKKISFMPPWGRTNRLDMTRFGDLSMI